MVLDDANKLGLTELRWIPLKFEDDEARKAKGNNTAGNHSKYNARTNFGRAEINP